MRRKNITNSLSPLLAVFSSMQEKQCFVVVFLLLVCAQTRAHQQASKQASCFSNAVCLYDHSLLYLLHPPFLLLHSLSFSLAHTHPHTLLNAMQRIVQGPCCASRTLSCELVFSTHFAAVCNHRSTSSHRQLRRTYTHTHRAKQSFLYIYDRHSVWDSCLKKKRDEKAKTYTHSYIRHVHAFSFAVDSSS